MNGRSLVLVVGCLLAVTACFVTNADQVYRWVDKDGQVHYSSTPPPATAARAEKVNVAAPQAVTMVAPAMPKLPQQDSRPRREHTQGDAEADRQIRDTWSNFTDALDGCQNIAHQLDDLRNGVTPNLTDAQRKAREQALEAQIKAHCPDE